MKRFYNNSFMGKMTESELGEWVKFEDYEAERDHALVSEELAESRLKFLEEINQENIKLTEELDILKKACKDYDDKIDKLLKENKPNNLYLDLFSTSLTFNIIFLMTIVYCFVK